MIIAVIGGKLQGVEAAYLAHKAGWQVRLIDKNEDVPAAGLCDDFLQVDVTRGTELRKGVNGADLILPALEDDEALEAILGEASSTGIPVAFDPGAYKISSSKLASNHLFAKIGIPFPRPWPHCSYPVLVKPSRSSGSQGVRIIHSEAEMEAFEKERRTEQPWVLQEYIDGPTYSLEVLACGEKTVPLQVTDLYMDGIYDCKRVTAPTVLPGPLAGAFENLAVEIAGAVGLHGIMDVEVISANQGLKVLEIDARLPSQTPITVYWSTGLNMVEMLAEMTLSGTLSVPRPEAPRGVVYEHIKVSPASIATHGEHIMSAGGALHGERNFFGADEAITNYHPGKDCWVATLIISAPTKRKAEEKRAAVLSEISSRLGVRRSTGCPSGAFFSIGNQIKP